MALPLQTAVEEATDPTWNHDGNAVYVRCRIVSPDIAGPRRRRRACSGAGKGDYPAGEKLACRCGRNTVSTAGQARLQCRNRSRGARLALASNRTRPTAIMAERRTGPTSQSRDL